jgi:PAS domain S-box-containing protein
MLPARQSPRAAWLIALSALGLATALRFALEPVLDGRLPFATYFVAVVVVGLSGNLGATLTTGLLALILGDSLFVTSGRSAFARGQLLVIALTVLLGTGSLVAILTGRLRRMGNRLNEAADIHSATVHREHARFQEIVASIPGVVWEAWGQPDSAQQRINFVSDYAQDMLGYAPEEWTSTPNFWLKLVPPEDRERAARVAATMFETGQSGENEFRWVAKDGHVIWVLARSSVIKNANGKPVGMRGVTFDITARKEAERHLALLAEISTLGATHPNFTDLAESIAARATAVIGDACIIRMVDGNMLKCVGYDHRDAEALPYLRALAEQTNLGVENPFYVELLGHARTVVAENVPVSEYQSLEGLVAPELIERYHRCSGVLCPLMSHGRVFGTLALRRFHGGKYTPSEVMLIEAIAAKAALVLDNARLIERVRTEAEEAGRARAEAVEAVRVKDEFLATLSHELRTPLNAILGWAQMLVDARVPPDRREAAIATIVRNAKSQEQLISDILDVERVMAGKIRLDPRRVDLREIVRVAAETVQPSADAKRVRLDLQLAPVVAPIIGDADRLKQVTWNVLSNAIKFAPANGRVDVRLEEAPNHVELVVEDNGPGITPEFIPVMFEPFRQADSSTTRTHKGMGLGLAIAKSLIEMHGGEITAANSHTPSRTGAVITIRLPRQSALASVAVSDAARPASAPSASTSLDEPSLDSLRVLVVEDDRDARELIGQILRRYGASVTLAASAADGFEHFTREPPDVLISDIEMPGEDGYTFIARIRALPIEAGRAVPAAAITAYASAADRLRALTAGFDAHVAKPVQPAQLAGVIATLARRRKEPTTATFGSAELMG